MVSDLNALRLGIVSLGLYELDLPEVRLRQARKVRLCLIGKEGISTMAMG